MLQLKRGSRLHCPCGSGAKIGEKDNSFAHIPNVRFTGAGPAADLERRTMTKPFWIPSIQEAKPSAAAAKPTFAEEAVVVSGEQMRFDLAHGVQHYTGHDEQAGSAKELGDLEGDVEPFRQEHGEEC